MARQSYNAFITEAGLPEDAGSVSKGDLTLEVLLEEKRNFDVSVKFEKLGVTDGQHGWTAEGDRLQHRTKIWRPLMFFRSPRRIDHCVHSTHKL